jgi:hypothetical protein
MSEFLFPARVKSVSDCVIARTRSYTLVAELIRRWHSTLPNAPPGFRIAFIVSAPNGMPLAAAMWGRPLARLEDQEHTLELTRLAHSPEAPCNTGSWALARMRRWIVENMPEIERLISYQDADVHCGTIYKADNWRQVYEKHTEHTWTNRPGRLGTERQHKVKWEFLLQRRPAN